ncbi:hypothetical protein EON81_24745, partial [bacterium]
MTEPVDELSIAVAILWLPGFGGASRRSAPAVTALLRRSGTLPKAAKALARAGHLDEAAALQDSRRIEQAERWRDEGRFLTWCDLAYPSRWKM